MVQVENWLKENSRRINLTVVSQETGIQYYTLYRCSTGIQELKKEQKEKLVAWISKLNLIN